MKNLFSTAVIATALALLVPNNGAEAVTGPVHSVSVASAEPVSSFATNVPAQAPDTKLAWIMAAGFLGLVVSRRLRGD